ncbi:MAG: hypothetical protein F6K18_33355 [Okeania sp. SIO2C2]|uniref:sulfotransferase n=1 Tax=Okeania sp. SIO2C2 TaxID=2607787 RepID=UPI0013BCA098|nr:sulfotransferase [Okeania sp. SIO2C2]NEP91299.1 hypothetical protein [Okeania sp. SIO2C2]
MVEINRSEQKTKHVVVVLGSGRSGTSVLMQVLASIGMSISENLVPPRFHNTLSPMEDEDMTNIYFKEIFPKVGSNSLLPLPYENMNCNRSLKDAIFRQLKQIIVKNTNKAKSIWGFKHPATSLILPLWFQAFNSTATVPIFLMAVRNPSTSASSRKKSFGHAEAIGELAWLSNYTEALHHIGADCFIVHYEDWFSEPTKIAKEILSYTGLDQYFTGDVKEVLSQVIKPNLNRSVHEDYQVQNEYVLKLYNVLKDCRGADFDRARLMAVVKECRQAMDGFKGWYLIAQENIARVSTLREQLQTAKEKQAEIPQLQKRIRELERENQRLSEMEKEIIRADEALNHLQELYPQNPTHDRL